MIKAGKIEKMIGGALSKNAPRISIITPAFKSARFIAAALQSVFSQTFQDFEIIVSNDGSPDTVDFEKNLAPFFENIIYIKHENLGAGAARNIAIEHSRGELLAFLDADDIWMPNFLASQIEFLEQNDFDLVYCDAYLFGNNCVKGKTYMQNAPSAGVTDFNALLDLRCSVITSGTLAKKKNIVDAGMFESEKVRAHDFVLWLKMAENGAKIGYQRKVLLQYRMHAESLSGNYFNQIEREIDVFRRVEKIFKLDETQKKIIKNQMKRLESALDIERGKRFLLERKFDSAKKAFRRANEYSRSLKLQLVIWLILLAPGLVLKFYKYCRAEEIQLFADVIKHI